MDFISPPGTKYYQAVGERGLKRCVFVPDAVKVGRIAGIWMVLLISMSSYSLFLTHQYLQHTKCLGGIYLRGRDLGQC